jgi:hypothetical protein
VTVTNDIALEYQPEVPTTRRPAREQNTFGGVILSTNMGPY